MERYVKELWATSDIAREVGVSTQAVTNWRKRHTDFPESLGRVGGRALYDKKAVQAWLIKKGKVSANG